VGGDDEALLASWDLALHDKAGSTRRLYREVLTGFARWLPDGASLVGAERRDCQRYFAALREEGRAQATIRSRWIALRSFYGWAADEGEVAENPMGDITVQRAEPPPVAIPDDHDVARLLQACGGRDFAARRDLALIRTAAATGGRIGELCGVGVADVDLKNRILSLRRGKARKGRGAGIDPETARTIDRYLRVRADHRLADLPALFITRFGPLTRKGAHAMLRRRCAEAGIPALHFNQLRDRFAYEYLRRGGTERNLAALGGWTDASITRRYGSALASDRALSEYDTLGGVL
jgi:site-specific recombinase XerD